MKKQYWYVIGILAGATLLRFYNIATASLWHDEAFSALLIRYPWHEMMYRIGLDVHPPLYYIALRLWYYLFGNSILSLRGFSGFFGVLTVFATYLFTKAAFKREDIALTATIFMALSPFQIEYVSEARMYTFGTFLIMISAYFLVFAFAAQKDYFAFKNSHPQITTEVDKKTYRSVVNRTWGYWFLFSLTTSGCMYTHYYLLFSTAGIGLFALYKLYKEHGFTFKYYRYLLAAYILDVILYIPWLKTFMFQFRQVQANYWIPKMDRWSIPLTNFKMLFGAGADSTNTSTDVWLILWVIVSLYIIYRVIKKETNTNKWLVILGFLVPYIGASLASLKQSIFLDRYFLFSGLFFTILVTLFIYLIKNIAIQRLMISLLIIISLVNFAKNWHDLDVKDNRGMGAVSDVLNANVVPTDKIYVMSSFEFFNFKYYNHTGVTALLYTPGITSISQLPHFSGTALLNNSDLIENLNSQVHSGDHVWILWTNAFGESVPVIPSNWVQVLHYQASDVHPYPGTVILTDEYRVQ